MGKNIKSYATTPSPFHREREASLTAKVLNPSFKIWYGLTVHIIRFYSHYTLCFRCLTSDRERHEIPANQVKFARFAPIPHELRKFRALRTKINTYGIDFQISDH